MRIPSGKTPMLLRVDWRAFPQAISFGLVTKVAARAAASFVALAGASVLATALASVLVLALPGTALASPGLCVGPVCADEIQRSSYNPWQLKLRLADQRGHHERVVVDCRDGVLSPQQGQVERGYAGAVARRACRLVAAG